MTVQLAWANETRPNKKMERFTNGVLRLSARLVATDLPTIV